jgi:uncharacterized lipoprotein YddW (UPF0748 family)
MKRCASGSRHSPRFARALLTTALVVGLWNTLPMTAHAAAAESPQRGYWVSRTALASLESVRRAITSAQASGSDTVFVPIALSAHDAEPFDGAREFIKAARERGWHVHAWIDVNRVAAADEFPASRDHVIYQHPEWLMVPRAIASQMIAMDPRGPAYLGQLARWTRSNAARVDGLYLSPVDPDAAGYVANLVAATVRRYVIDGVYLDALRFPGSDFDFSRHALDVFRARQRTQLTASEQARLDAIESIDPFGYTVEFPDEWAAFKQARLTALLTQLHAAIKNFSPALTVTAAVAQEEAVRAEQLQDWRSWLANGLIDGVGHRNASGSVVLLSLEGVLPVLPGTGQATTAGSR